MIFLPHNRNISVELIKEEEPEEATILLPSDYRPAADPYAVVRVAEHGGAQDCQNPWAPGWLLVVEAQMIREITYDGQTYHTIAENYVIGSLSSNARPTSNRRR